MRASVLLLCSILAATSAWATGVRPRLDGEWVGTRNGVAITWLVGGDGRARIDGRGADYQIHGDTLAVRFDSPAQCDSALYETAVYRFTPDTEAMRLFVYGFDLGRQGVLLYRTWTEPPPEDAAPPPPPAPPQTTPAEPHHPAR